MDLFPLAGVIKESAKEEVSHDIKKGFQILQRRCIHRGQHDILDKEPQDWMHPVQQDNRDGI